MTELDDLDWNMRGGIPDRPMRRRSFLAGILPALAALLFPAKAQSDMVDTVEALELELPPDHELVVIGPYFAGPVERMTVAGGYVTRWIDV